MSSRFVLALSLGLGLVAACGSTPAKESKYPPLPEGCDVAIFSEIPPMPTDNIGPVSATCDESISDADCMRTLKDQACTLGADVIWDAQDTPSKQGNKKRLSGRAAHKKAGGK